MLKVKNLNKTYQSKNGISHQALKDINLVFGERGFVFIKGKSGSGKSTLLNVLGGLDNFESGDIVIKNKSSRDFKAKDWDSYRNTYLGFVFQDFNIIENYSIGKNISLALELQGTSKKENKSAVKKILKAVDLEAFAKRKPNELSGGQKQRIAIARALVKNPEIILADEPTGNLDTQTGEQILNILRKLADEKLIIMVSHDMKSAYKYADRIITMSDGEVVRDEYNEGGLKYIEDKVDNYRTNGSITNVIRVPKGKKVEKGQLEKINHILKSDQGKIFIPISNNKELTENDIHNINKILGNSNDDEFLIIANKVSDIQGSNNESLKGRTNPAEHSMGTIASAFRLIKSKLPFSNSIQMAFNAIWRNKAKLIFTSILFLVALALFGFSETITKFQFSNAISNSYIEGDMKIIPLSNREEVIGWEKTEKATVPFIADELDYVMGKFDKIRFTKLYNFSGSGVVISSESKIVKPKVLKGFLEMDTINDLNLEIIAGAFPKDNNEIMLTDFVADYLIEEDDDITKYEDLIDTDYNVGKNTYMIKGVADTDYEEFLYLNDIAASQMKDLLSEVGTFTSQDESIYSRIIVSGGFYEEYVKNIKAFGRVFSFQVPAVDAENVWDTKWIGEALAVFDEDILEHPNREQFLYVPDGFKGLGENEILVSSEALAGLNNLDNPDSIMEYMNTIEPNASYSVYDALVDEKMMPEESVEVSIVSNENWVRIDKKDYTVVGVIDFNMYNQIISADYMYNYAKEHGGEFTPEDIEMFESNFGHYNYRATVEYLRVRLTGIDIKVLGEQKHFEQNPDGNNDYWGYVNKLASQSKIKVVNSFEQVHAPILMNEAGFNELTPYKTDSIQNIVVKLTSDDEYNNEFFSFIEDYDYKHDTLSGNILGVFNDFIDDSKDIFRYVSLGLAIFATLLIFTNISASVLASKKEIGTLRAIGARGRDVATIFVAEAVILASFAAILSNIALTVTTKVLNTNLTSKMGMPISIFNSSIFIGLEIFVLAYVVVVLASFVPVKGVSLMKPIDAIKNK